MTLIQRQILLNNLLTKAFCPTGPGGVYAPTCSPGGSGGGVWKPTLTSKEAEIFRSNSVVKQDLYHQASSKRIDSIKKDGFNRDEAGGKSWQGSGLYLSENPISTFGDSGIKVAINVKKPFKGTTEEVEAKVSELKKKIKPPPFKNPVTGEIVKDPAGNPLRFWPDSKTEGNALRDAWEKEGFDSIIMDSSGLKVFVVFDPKNLVVIEN